MSKENKSVRLASWIPEEQAEIEKMLKTVTPSEVDLGQYLKKEKELKCLKVHWNGMEFWKGFQNGNGKGEFWTTNKNSPTIINLCTGKPRGNLAWAEEGGNPAGKPKGAKNRISVRDVCDTVGVNPAELIAAVAKRDKGLLRKYGVHDLKNLSLAMQVKCAMYLLDKQVPNLKPADIGADGEAQLSTEVQEVDTSKQIQAYIPAMQTEPVLQLSKEQYEEIEQVGVKQYMKDHEHETEPYDVNDGDESMVWRTDE